MKTNSYIEKKNTHKSNTTGKNHCDDKGFKVFMFDKGIS